MASFFRENVENLKNSFANSPLGKQLEGLSFGNLEEADDTNLAANESDISAKLCDDNGKQYKTESGKLLPNNTYTFGEVTYKTDDNGRVYCVNGKLKPNTTYLLNGNIYKTDSQGRLIESEAKPERTPENERDNEAQQRVGGKNRRPNDQGGHIAGRDLGGDAGEGNLVAMDSRINQSDYKRMENDVKDAVDAGQEVTVKTKLAYKDGKSERPDFIESTVTADGQVTVYKFDNNIDGSLKSEVPENGRDVVNEKLDKTDGRVSSIKEEYDDKGNLVQTTVYVTYKGEDGSNYRVSVVIENK